MLDWSLFWETVWPMVPALLRIALGLVGLALLGLAFQERRARAVRIAAGIGAAAVFGTIVVMLALYLFGA